MDCLFAARQGQSSAVAALIDDLLPRLARMAGHYARRTGHDRDELLQEALVSVLETLPKLDLGIGTPVQYLLRVARWRMLDAVRHARLRRMAPLEQLSERPGAAPPSVPEKLDLESFLASLTPRQRAIVSHLLEGRTWREAGSALGCTSANVAYHMRAIREAYLARWSA